MKYIYIIFFAIAIIFTFLLFNVPVESGRQQTPMVYRDTDAGVICYYFVDGQGAAISCVRVY